MSEERTPTAQQRAIIRHDLRAPLVVIAGAGSGKTATLVDRIHHLVREAGVDPRSILAATFSRSAAAELAARLVRRLGTRAEEITISTFHAFCREMLLVHAYRARIEPDLEVLEEGAALTRFAVVFRELLEGRIAVEAPRGLDLLASGRTMADLYRLVTTATEEGLDGRALLAACAATRARLLPPDGEPQPLSIAGALVTGSGGGFYTRAYGGANAGDPKPDEAFQRSHLAPTRETLTTQLDEEARVARLIAAVMERFDALLAERGEVTYAHLIAKLERMLIEEPEHAAAIRYRFTHCLVDEYQDTNAAQQRLIERIFGAGLHGVMLVGDPRQSIYGFRNARPEAIEALAERHEHAGIDDNFRSLQPILDAAHHAIRRQRPDDTPLRQQRDAQPDGSEVSVFVAYAASRATAQARAAEAGAIAAEIERLVAEHALAFGDVAILLRRKTHAQAYVEALAARGIPARTTGGIGFYEAPEIEEAIAWLRFADDPTDDVALLRVLRCGIIGLNEAAIAALAPSDDGTRDADGLRVRFARSVLDGPLPDELTADSRERLETLRSIVGELEGIGTLPLAEAIQRILLGSGLEHRYALQAQRSLDGRQAVANLRRLEQIAQGFAQGMPDARIANFVMHLESLREVAFDEREADPPAADAVTIATIHWAKGREWPAVFVADVTPNVFPGRHPPTRVLWNYDERAPIVARDEEGAPTYHALRARFGVHGEAARDAWAQRELREEVRLFYVALTRARDRLYVCGTVPISSAGAERPSEFLAQIAALPGVTTTVVHAAA
ncbi:MAG: ATP-dependent helicase, partial [bacterium]|nr:ATP-dependent helicase [bacterium]